MTPRRRHNLATIACEHKIGSAAPLVMLLVVLL